MRKNDACQYWEIEKATLHEKYQISTSNDWLKKIDLSMKRQNIPILCGAEIFSLMLGWLQW